MDLKPAAGMATAITRVTTVCLSQSLCIFMFPNFISEPMTGANWRKFFGARVSGRQGCVIFFRGWSQQFGEDRSQAVRPHLVTFNVQMQPVTIRHALEQLAIFISQSVVDV